MNFYFGPRISFLLMSFPQQFGSVPTGKKLRPSEAFSFLRNNSAKILNAHFPIHIHFSALYVGSLTLFFGLRKGQLSAECISTETSFL